MRQEILEGLDWTIYCIWSTDSFEDAEAETTILINFIEDKVKNKLN